MKRILTTITLAVTVASASQAVAQRHHYHRGPAYRGSTGYGVYGGGHASTAAEGAARGMADVVRARGEANVNNAIAATQAQEARSAYMDNQVKAVETYYAKKRIWRAEEARKRKKTEASLGRYLAKLRAEPTRPTSSQLDPVTGYLRWPRELRGGEFASQRNTLNKLFDKRAQYGTFTDNDFAQADDAIESWIAAIDADKSKTTFKQRVTMVTFLKNLQNEAQESLQ